jgi:hypothetical protein
MVRAVRAARREPGDVVVHDAEQTTGARVLEPGGLEVLHVLVEVGAHLLGNDWWLALVGGAVSGTLFGPLAHRQNQRARELATGLSPAEQRAALRAALRGPVPQRPEVRAAAQRLAERQLAETRRQRTFSVVTFGAFLLLSLYLALATIPWWWAAIAFWTFLLVGQAWYPRHLARRAALLARG